MKYLFCLMLMTCGCINNIETTRRDLVNDSVSITTLKAGQLTSGVYVIEYEGNKYIVVDDHDGVAICPVLPVKVEK